VIQVIGEGLVVVDVAALELSTGVVVGVRVPGKLGVEPHVLVRKEAGLRSQTFEDVVRSLADGFIEPRPVTSFSGQLRPKIVH